MNNLRFFVEIFTDTVSAIFSNDRVMVGFGKVLNNMTYVAELGAGFDQCNPL